MAGPGKPIDKVIQDYRCEHLLPKEIPSTAPMQEFLASEGFFVDENISWPEVFTILDDNQYLWGLAGSALNECGLVHPFDPQKIPEEIKRNLDTYIKDKRKDFPTKDEFCRYAADALFHYGSPQVALDYDIRDGSIMRAAVGVLEIADKIGIVNENSVSYIEPALRDIMGLQIFVNEAFPPPAEPVFHTETRDKSNLPPAWDYKAEEIFNESLLGNTEVGDCSDVANRTAAAMLYSAAECDLEVATWTRHIQVFLTKLPTDAWESTIPMTNPSYDSDPLSRLFSMNYVENEKECITTKKDASAESSSQGLRLLQVLLPNQLDVKRLLPLVLDDAEKQVLFKDLAENYNRSTAYNSLAFSAAKKGDGATALEMVKKAVALDPWNEFLYRDAINILARFDYPQYLNSFDVFRVFQPEMSQRTAEAGLKNARSNKKPTRSDYYEAFWLEKLGDLGDLDNAESICSAALAKETDPSMREALVILKAQILSKQGKLSEANRLCERYLDENPSSIGIKTSLMSGYSANSEEGNLKVLCEEELNNVEPVPRGYANIFLGIVSGMEGNKEAAVEFFTEAQALIPNEPSAQLGLADLLVAKGDYKKASVYQKKAQEMNPFNVGHHYSRAQLHLYEGDIVRAESWSNLAIKLSGDRADFFMKGFIALEKDDLQTAAEAFSVGLSKNELDPWSNLGVAIALSEADIPDYQIYMDNVEKSKLRNEFYYYMLGRIEDRHGDSETAQEYYMMALDLAPGAKFIERRLENL